jgi:hypothetical protein
MKICEIIPHQLNQNCSVQFIRDTVRMTTRDVYNDIGFMYKLNRFDDE